MLNAHQAILLRLARLERRLDRLELEAGLPPLPLAPDEADLRSASDRDHSPGALEPAPPVAEPATTPFLIEPAASTPAPLRSAAPSVLPLRAAADEQPEESPSLERLIGGRWYAILGGLVVIIGVAFFYQYALQQGWFRLLPDWSKCVLGAAFGAALLAAAEVIRPRINAWAAVGLASAGIGTMYVSTFAARARYDLLGVPAAFILLTLCAGIGIVFAARARLVAVALVSLIGGYLTPFLLHGPGRASILPPYWAMLLIVGLTLSARLGGSFRLARALTALATLVFGAGWVLAVGPEHPLLALAFIAFTWITLQAELWWAAVRGRPAPPLLPGTPPVWRDWSPILTSFIATVWAATLAVLHGRAWGHYPDWLGPAGLCAITATPSLILAGNLRVLRDAPTTGPERFGAGLAAQAGGLFIAAVALALSGSMEVIAWLAMGVAAIAAGRWMDARSLRFYGAALLSIATARLIAYDSMTGLAAGAPSGLLGLVPSTWMLLTILAAAAWLAAAVLTALDSPREDDSDAPAPTGRIRPWIPAAIATALLMAAFLHLRASELPIALAWMAIGAALLPMTGLLRSMRQETLASRLQLSAIAAGPITLALIPWVISIVNRDWSSIPDPPGLHRGLVVAILLAAEFAWAAWTLTPPLPADRASDPDLLDRRAAIRGLGLGMATLLIFTATSFEAARLAGLLFTDRTSQLAAVSLWWGVFSIALLVIGFLPVTTGRADPFSTRHTLGKLPRQTGLALLGLATAKALFYDTAQVSLGWRVISVLALGLLMLAVGVVYARLTERERMAPAR